MKFFHFFQFPITAQLFFCFLSPKKQNVRTVLHLLLNYHHRFHLLCTEYYINLQQLVEYTTYLPHVHLYFWHELFPNYDLQFHNWLSNAFVDIANVWQQKYHPWHIAEYQKVWDLHRKKFYLLFSIYKQTIRSCNTFLFH